MIGDAAAEPAASAALMNGYLAHALDYDDTHHESRVHPSAVVVPTALAAGEANRASGKEILIAAVTGFEVVIRLGLAAPGQYHERGWHATSVCGSVAAAGIAGRLLGLGPEQLVHALGIATSTACGLRESYLGEATDTKAFHAGWAAQSGIVAAELAAEGFTGAATALEGRFGYLNAFLAPEPWDLASHVRTLGVTWFVPGVAYKLFPCGSLAHGCIDAAIEISRSPGFDAGQVLEVTCVVPGGMASTICEPEQTKLDPRSGYEAKFSVQYAVAAALARERVTESEFQAEALADPEIRALLGKVRYEADPTMPFPAKYPGGVHVKLRNGARLEAWRANSPGTPDRPIRDEEIVQKFRANAADTPAATRVSEIVERVLSLETEDEIALLMSLCHGG